MTDLRTIERPEASFYFTAPVASDSELNTEDPLGLDYVAQQVGLMILPSLTTRSSRAQGFAMVLYGLDLAAKAVDRFGCSSSDGMKRELFERWERFWALATLEYRGGVLPRGDWDIMRGIRGVKNAWAPGSHALPLDFPLISRQQELGNLGAYLVPLRKSGLVHDGDIRPTPAALEILDAFWDDPRKRNHAGRYEEYALMAMSPDRTHIGRKHGGLTLRAVGEKSRLSSLVELGRRQQQRRLNEALLQTTRDSTTLELSALVEAASRAKVRRPRHILRALIKGEFGRPTQRLRDLLRTALSFGDFMRGAVAAFDRAYLAVEEAGWIAAPDAVARKTFGGGALRALHRDASKLLKAPCVAEIRGLPIHGAACIHLAERLATASHGEGLECLLRYHASVQSDRRRARGWIQDEAGKLVLAVTSYTARPETPRFPSFKLDVVRTLLADVGRLPYGGFGDGS